MMKKISNNHCGNDEPKGKTTDSFKLVEGPIDE